jgi:hypothetical protein
MLGELDNIDGRGRRWRFTAGCVGTVLLSPGGRAGAAAWPVVALAAGGAGVYASVVARFGLGGGDWVALAIVAILAVSYTITISVLLRRRGVALPGLLCGLLVAVVWLAASGFTFSGIITRPWATWSLPVLMIVLPVLLGVLGTLWGGSVAAAQRIARLAAYSAGLGVFLYATVAVAVLGAGGPPDDSGWTVGAIVSDRLTTNATFELWFLPLTTAAVAWLAAAATVRLRPRLAVAARPGTSSEVPFTAAGPTAGPAAGPTGDLAEGPAVRARARQRSARVLAWSVIVVAVLLSVAFVFVK